VGTEIGTVKSDSALFEAIHEVIAYGLEEENALSEAFRESLDCLREAYMIACPMQADEES